MAANVSPMLALRVLYAPSTVFNQLAAGAPAAPRVFFRLALWLLVLPPIFAFFGTMNFGWRLGAGEAVSLGAGAMLGVSAAYFATLLFGFFSVVVVARWMAQTYGASEDFGTHFALVTMVGTPLLLGSAIHLYPDAFVNLIVLAPAIAWSLYLLFRGIPLTLGIDPQRGILMASSLIAYLLVASVSLLGVTVVLWGYGIGPSVGL